MEFSLREWLIVIGVAIIVVILVDGFRRYKKGQKFAQLEDEYSDLDGPDDDVLVGRATPVSHAKPAAARRVVQEKPTVSAFENARKTAHSPLADVPHKVDSGPELDRGKEMHLDELASLVPERDFGDSAVSEQNYADDGFYEPDEPEVSTSYQTKRPYKDESYQENLSYQEEEVDNDYERHYSAVDINQVTPHDGFDDEIEEDDSESEIEEVIVINIFAPENQNFAGIELLQLILNCGMRYGDMDIFHRHEDGFDRGRVQFSMANAIEPGTFDLETMGETECPGVSFFMGLPGPKNSMKAFDFMLETAQTLVRNLGGELRDERRTPMSDQTIAHCRQRIRDFERRRLMRSKQPK
ncbi:cell division protein ZipA [Marinomonas algarum]|uniref:Cell division protein ZipA n=1 Tax=Marinomonas algarum TaxID=2883105 RepID=A0A9X1IN56_9GAMM|nr:cell division protein ZipA [Marinomonas algarum]MCB5162002.1 cell division protein ZipA [Marinomonas algarum]